MRWFVEVSTIGDSAAPARVCVEAAQWQAGLEGARRLLKDTSPLAQLSIEVLDDGYRAVNPALRLRYVIRRAPPNAALTEESDIRPSSSPPPAEAARDRVRHEPPAPSAPLAVPLDTVPPAPAPPSRQPSGARTSAPEPAEVVPRPPPPLPEPISPEPSRVLRRRVEEPTADGPLLYCEVAYVVAPGLGREAAERVLLQRFREVCAELEDRPVRKYVQLAVFDHAFEKRPLRPPLATLAWKDWRGVPSVAFPGFGDAAPEPSRPPPSSGGTGSPSAPPSAPLHSRPGSSTPPSADRVRVSPSIPVGAPDVPRPPRLPVIDPSGEPEHR